MRLALLTTVFPALFFISPAKVTPPEPPVINVPQDVLALPGGLDDIPVLNSNSPEVVPNEGILLSTYPSAGMASPKAHLDYPLQGRFDLFFHHIANAIKSEDTRTLYLGFLVKNASEDKVTLRILQSASYCSRPDSPFIDLPPVSNNDKGKLYSGPGDRAMLAILRDDDQPGWKSKITLAPGAEKLVFVKDLQVRRFLEPLNGRSALIRFSSDGPVYTALVALYSRTPKGSDRDRQPKCCDFQSMLRDGALCSPRERLPSVPGSKGPTIYGRVAGISKGTAWSTIQGSKPAPTTDIKPGQTISYVLSTLVGATLGTDQVQSAPMIVRYPDTAYESHGNYAVNYDLTLPITNDSDKPVKVSVTLQSPLKRSISKHSLVYLENAVEHTFFRGTVRFEYQDDEKNEHVTYIHLVEKQGMKMPPLLEFNLKPHETRPFRATFLYPPDSTPPQVLTFKSTLEPSKSLSDPAKAETGNKLESTESGTDKAKAVKTESTKSEGKANSKSEPIESESKSESTKSESTKSESTKSESTKSESSKSESAKSESTKKSD